MQFGVYIIISFHMYGSTGKYKSIKIFGNQVAQVGKEGFLP